MGCEIPRRVECNYISFLSAYMNGLGLMHNSTEECSHTCKAGLKWHGSHLLIHWPIEQSRCDPHVEVFFCKITWKLLLLSVSVLAATIRLVHKDGMQFFNWSNMFHCTHQFFLQLFSYGTTHNTIQFFFLIRNPHDTELVLSSAFLWLLV